MRLKIEDYALIGDCESCALVGIDGAIDWLCWPRFDSDACFAALLGNEDNGRWLIAATDPKAKVTRRYRGDTLILETRFETADGAATVIDFMPPRGSSPELVRLVRGEWGRVAFRMELLPRFGYGAVRPWVQRTEGGAHRAIAGPDMVVLRTPVGIRDEGGRLLGEFTVSRVSRRPSPSPGRRRTCRSRRRPALARPWPRPSSSGATGRPRRTSPAAGRNRSSGR